MQGVYDLMINLSDFSRASTALKTIVLGKVEKIYFAKHQEWRLLSLMNGIFLNLLLT